MNASDRHHHSTKTARLVLMLFVVLLIYDGAIRKWLLQDYEQVVFIAKDIVLLLGVAFLLFNRSRPVPVRMPYFAKAALACYACWVVLELFNPQLPNLLVGLWGVKAHLLYASLVIIVPLAFETTTGVLNALERAYPKAVIPVVSLALLQLAAPATSFINQQVRGGVEGVAVFGADGLVRVTGTFSYLSGMAALVQVSVLLGVGLFLAGARSKGFLIGLGFALMAVPATGSRGVVVAVIAGVLILLLAAAACRFISGGYALFAACTLAGLAALSLNYQGGTWEALAQRAEGSRGDESRAITVFTNAFSYFETAGIVGFGAGSANLGAPALAERGDQFWWLPPDMGFEDESGRLVIELGIVGWAISLSMRVIFLGWAAMLALKGASRSSRVAGVICLPTVALAVHLGSGVFSVPLAAAFYWFCIALLAIATRSDFDLRATVSRTRVSKELLL